MKKIFLLFFCISFLFLFNIRFIFAFTLSASPVQFYVPENLKKSFEGKVEIYRSNIQENLYLQVEFEEKLKPHFRSFQQTRLLIPKGVESVEYSFEIFPSILKLEEKTFSINFYPEQTSDSGLSNQIRQGIGIPLRIGESKIKKQVEAKKESFDFFLFSTSYQFLTKQLKSTVKVKNTSQDPINIFSVFSSFQNSKETIKSKKLDSVNKLNPNEEKEFLFQTNSVIGCGNISVRINGEEKRFLYCPSFQKVFEFLKNTVLYFFLFSFFIAGFFFYKKKYYFVSFFLVFCVFSFVSYFYFLPIFLISDKKFVENQFYLNKTKEEKYRLLSPLFLAELNHSFFIQKNNFNGVFVLDKTESSELNKTIFYQFLSTNFQKFQIETVFDEIFQMGISEQGTLGYLFGKEKQKIKNCFFIMLNSEKACANLPKQLTENIEKIEISNERQPIVRFYKKDQFFDYDFWKEKIVNIKDFSGEFSFSFLEKKETDLILHETKFDPLNFGTFFFEKELYRFCFSCEFAKKDLILKKENEYFKINHNERILEKIFEQKNEIQKIYLFENGEVITNP